MSSRWTTEDVRYLRAHAHEGAEAVAKALGRSVSAVQVRASREGVSLIRFWVCPKCCERTYQPLMVSSGWCRACTLEVGADRAERVNDKLRREMKAEQRRIREAERRRQRLYKDNSKWQKRLCRFDEGKK